MSCTKRGRRAVNARLDQLVDAELVVAGLSERHDVIGIDAVDAHLHQIVDVQVLVALRFDRLDEAPAHVVNRQPQHIVGRQRPAGGLHRCHELGVRGEGEVAVPRP